METPVASTSTSPPLPPAPDVTIDGCGCVTYRQATCCTGLLSIGFALCLFSHEVSLEGGFAIKNYVVIAFCFVWLIVDSLLLLGAFKRAHFLLLPWMILICLLNPMFVVGIVVGVKVIASCSRIQDARSCDRQVHMFGSSRTYEAGAKVALLSVMLIINGFICHKSRESKTILNKTYSRFHDDNEFETDVPLCPPGDDSPETNT